jgi:hypothetical protein
LLDASAGIEADANRLKKESPHGFHRAGFEFRLRANLA